MTSTIFARAQVRVPATTANLGAGFDCVGMALDKWLRVSVELSSGPRDERGLVTMHRTGTLRALDRAGISDPRRDLIYIGYRQVERQFHGRNGFNGRLHFEGNSDIPIGRGLGSSAAALLAGAALANSALDLGLGLEQLAQICARIEGHGDNVGAAAFGGAVLVSPDSAGWHFSALPVHDSLGFAFAVPEFESRTELARAALPHFVKFTDAVLAAARSASLVRALQTADGNLITAGLNDVLHVPYRKHLVPHYDLIVQAARNAGAFGATLSGSGSSIVALAPRARAPHVAECMADAWRAAGIDAHGFATGLCHAGLSVQSPLSALNPPPPHIPPAPIRLPRSIACP